MDKSKIILDVPLTATSQLQDNTVSSNYQRIVNIVIDHIMTYSYIEESKVEPIQNDSSLTIGLEGSWGSGKSTFLNFIKEGLNNKDKKIPIIEFNPWFIIDDKTLISQFFEHLSNKLTPLKGVLKQVGSKFGHLSKVLKPVTSIISAFNPIIGALAKELLNYTGDLSEGLKQDYTDVFEVYNDIKKELSKLKKPVIVILDDLDRMHAKEIRQMLNALKSIGNLPNIIYVIAYDRDIVSKVMSSEGVDGEKYLEKIIQITIPIPKVGWFKLLEFLNKHIESYKIIDVDNQSIFDELAYLLSKHITTYRIAKLILNRLQYRLLYDFGNLCKADLFILSIIEIINPNVAATLAKLKPINTDEHNGPEVTIYNWEQRKTTFIKEFNALYLITPECFPASDSANVESSHTRQKLNTKQLFEWRFLQFLLHLILDFDSTDNFPKDFIYYEISMENQKHRLKENKFFDKYFEFADYDDCSFNQYIGLISEISRDNKADVLLKSAPEFIQVFLTMCIYEFMPDHFDVFLIILKDLMAMFYLEKDIEIVYLLNNLFWKLFKVPEYESRTFKIIMHDKCPVYYLITFYDSITSKDVPPTSRKENHEKFGSQSLNEIATKIILQKDNIKGSLMFGRILYYINQFKTTEGMREIIEELIQTDEGFFDILWGYSSRSNGNISRIGIEHVVLLYDIDIVENRMRKILTSDLFQALTSDKKKAINTCIKDIEKIKLSNANKEKWSRDR